MVWTDEAKRRTETADVIAANRAMYAAEITPQGLLRLPPIATACLLGPTTADNQYAASHIPDVIPVSREIPDSTTQQPFHQNAPDAPLRPKTSTGPKRQSDFT